MDTASLWNPLPWLLVIALCIAIADAVARRSAFYQTRLAEESTGRYGAIDGLRGYLALAVFGTHALHMYFLHARGSWVSDEASFVGSASEAGVSLFFMITAFLFWRRVLESGAAFNVTGFLAGRVRRLVPMYLVSVMLVVVVAVATNGFSESGGPMKFAKDLRPWLSFGFLTTGDLNGIRDGRAMNAVYWTLAYEWMFYLTLPLFALARRGWAAVGLVLVVGFFGKQSPIVLNFLFGALAATAVHHGLLKGRLASPALTLVPIALLGVATSPLFETVYGVLPELLLFVFFLFVVDGNTLFGLLKTRASRFLGQVSYSLYLVHCIALYVIVGLAAGHVPLQELDAAQYWTIAAAAAAVTIAISAFTYRYIEYPFIRKPARTPPMVEPATAQPSNAAAAAWSPAPAR
jgi:peptidoglycan/LPS O-acetylase OafA/YrhL